MSDSKQFFSPEAAECRHRLTEELADLAHARWSGWMEYLFSKAPVNPDGSFTITPDLVARWQRQIATPYADLSEQEKASDRVEADRVMAIIDEFCNE